MNSKVSAETLLSTYERGVSRREWTVGLLGAFCSYALILWLC
ncbi:MULTISPECIES: hypothetical protein [Limnobacter]|uniref:Uncharacterized protein n=1 Tax=Limnobacter litoralis TaxID=481366 RepID=A0ABQ5YUH4_9BURK|nr:MULTISPECIES: hypothetical protein [Limnobacter]GLR27687.1 hypothetical protein GCM10007875_27790 [Limnobacter litoralis]HEX5484661.1 hypothetical protein [Limnobacter sp.]